MLANLAVKVVKAGFFKKFKQNEVRFKKSEISNPKSKIADF